MEGGDDVTLEPGDILKLVKVEGGGNLRVVTTDEHTVEGTVPESYLRKRDKGGTMDGRMTSNARDWHVTTSTYTVYIVLAITCRSCASQEAQMVLGLGMEKIASQLSCKLFVTSSR